MVFNRRLSAPRYDDDLIAALPDPKDLTSEQRRGIIARYTADAWRGRVYAVRYFLTFMVSGVAVSMIAVLYGRGGFGLVLSATALIALGFLIAVLLIAAIASSVEKTRVLQPAE